MLSVCSQCALNTYPVNTTVWVSLTLVLLSTTRACSQPAGLFKAGGLIACDGERARRTRRRWRATAARARERARERRRRGAPRCSGLCAARLWLSAGAAAPGLAVGAGAGGLSRAQKRQAQRDKTLDQAQRDGALDGRSRAGQDRLQRLVQARCKSRERESERQERPERDRNIYRESDESDQRDREIPPPTGRGKYRKREPVQGGAARR